MAATGVVRLSDPAMRASPRALLERIGKCLLFGCDRAQTLRAASLIRRIANEGLDLHAASQGARVAFPPRRITLGPRGPLGDFDFAGPYGAMAQEATSALIRKAQQMASASSPPTSPRPTWREPILLYANSRCRPLLGTDHQTRNDPPTVFVSVTQNTRLSDLGSPEIVTHVRSVTHHYPYAVFVYRFEHFEEPVFRAFQRLWLKKNPGPLDKLIQGVTALEKETWDRPDAVEDVGGAA